MHSEKILSAPVALFLGAGASKPLDKLLMYEFIDHLANTSPFRESSLFQTIVGQERDLEFLFEELQDWSVRKYRVVDPNRPGARIARMPTIGDPIKGAIGALPDRPFESVLDDLTMHARALEQELRRQVFEHYREVDRAKAADLYSPILDGIFGNSSAPAPLVVFTTNYDPSVESVFEENPQAYALMDGFWHDAPSRQYVWKRTQFDTFTLSPGKRNVVLFKLHGSTDWIKRGKQSIKALPFFADDRKDYENILIYPAKRKVAIEDPYFTAYDYLQRTMDHARLCIVIGYSFRDYDALTKLMSAALMNSALRLLVIDPRAKEICKMLSSYGIRCNSLQKQFGNASDTAEILTSIRSALTATHHPVVAP